MIVSNLSDERLYNVCSSEIAFLYKRFPSKNEVLESETVRLEKVNLESI